MTDNFCIPQSRRLPYPPFERSLQHMNDLIRLQESDVDESEIDSLGHMNVRFYLGRVATANLKLLQSIDIEPSEGQVIRRVDTYNRFHQEQFAGNKLSVHGGLTSISHDCITAYYEIRNRDNNTLAASFIITSKLVNASSETALTLQGINKEKLQTYTVAIPAHGKPRSLTITPPKLVSYQEIAPLIPDETTPQSINGRREGIVLAEDCDAHGLLKEEIDPMFILFRPQPGQTLKNIGPPILRDEHGRRYSWAMMEIRNISWQRPCQDDTIISLSADVNTGEKWRHSRRWMFAKKTGVLLGISDHAAVCIDLDARKAIPIPSEVRQSTMQKSLLAFI